MWCRHCQQDVPVIACSTSGPLLCPRCESTVRPPNDSGIELTTLDPPERIPAEPAPAIDYTLPRVDDHAWDSLREIGRKLRSPASFVADQMASGPTFPMPAPLVKPVTTEAPTYRNHRTGTGRGISALLLAGLVTLTGGLAWMAASPLVGSGSWQAAMTATMAGESALIVGLSWMAVRLWKNSRRMNGQLEGVDRQLADIQLTTGEMAAARMTNSQSYYQHFGSATSPPLAVANLRGQLDELACRLSA